MWKRIFRLPSSPNYRRVVSPTQGNYSIRRGSCFFAVQRPHACDNDDRSCRSRQNHHHMITRSIRSASKAVDYEWDKDDIDEWNDEEYIRFREEMSEKEKQQQAHEQQQQDIRDSWSTKTGRGWTDPWDLEDTLASNFEYKDLPDWSSSAVSRISLERVQIYNEKIPTLAVLAKLPLPKGPPPHPGLGQAKSYALYRKRSHYQYVYEQVQILAETKVKEIQNRGKDIDLDLKQDAIDELYEDIDASLSEKEMILSKHPMFNMWVQKAIEEYLGSIQYQYLLEKVKIITQPKITAWQNSDKKTCWDLNQDELYEDIIADLSKELDNEKMMLVIDKQQLEKVLTDYLSTIQYQHISEQVYEILAENKKLEGDSNANQHNDHAVWDTQLYETTVATLSTRESILEKHPMFRIWIKKALKQSTGDDTGTSIEKVSKTNNNGVFPIFMDCFDDQSDTITDVAPKILHPLKYSTKHATRGSMVEEWAIAAHKTTKRIMIRQCTKQIAKLIADNAKKPKRILVTGRQGVGKTATLAAIVASARSSGFIVLYLPDGDRLRKNGYYIEPNERRVGIFDLPILSQEVCSSLLHNHETDLQELYCTRPDFEEFFTTEERDKVISGTDTMSLADLLKVGVDKEALAPMCYALTVHLLMKQTSKPFMIVADEFNCYYDEGQYYHNDYDESVKQAIPYNQISLFKPLLDGMALSLNMEGDDDTPPALMQQGAIVVATSESHAIPRKVTDALILNARIQQRNKVHVCEVPRLSSIEVEHMLANYECIGVGKLRLDRGETIMNPQEVAYLRVVSGQVAQKLMDASMM